MRLLRGIETIFLNQYVNKRSKTIDNMTSMRFSNVLIWKEIFLKSVAGYAGGKVVKKL